MWYTVGVESRVSEQHPEIERARSGTIWDRHAPAFLVWFEGIRYVP